MISQVLVVVFLASIYVEAKFISGRGFFDEGNCFEIVLINQIHFFLLADWSPVEIVVKVPRHLTLLTSERDGETSSECKLSFTEFINFLSLFIIFSRNEIDFYLQLSNDSYVEYNNCSGCSSVHDTHRSMYRQYRNIPQSANYTQGVLSTIDAER